MIAAGGQLLPPWPAMVVWVCAWGAVAYGVFLRSKHLLNATALRAVSVTVLNLAIDLLALWVAFNFWQAGTPNAELELTRPELVFDRPTNIGANIKFGNVGDDEATYKHSVVDELVDPEDVIDPQRQVVLKRLRQRLDAGSAPMYSGAIGKNQGRLFTHRKQVSPEDLIRFKAGRKTWVIAGEVRYRDWWIADRDTMPLCFIFNATSIVASCVLPD